MNTLRLIPFLKPNTKVARIFDGDFHIYSVLANNGNLTLILPSNKTRWSTMTQRNLERGLSNQLESVEREVIDLNDLIDLGLPFIRSETKSDGWKKESTHTYISKQKAFKKEKRILEKNIKKRGMDLQYQ